MLLCLDIFAVVVLGHIHKVLIHTAFSRFCSQMDGYMLFSFIFALAIIGQQTGEKLGLSEWEQQKWNWTMNDSWVIEENRIEIPEPMAQAFFFWTEFTCSFNYLCIPLYEAVVMGSLGAQKRGKGRLQRSKRLGRPRGSRQDRKNKEEGR